jgi:hypothetical protein
MGWLEIPCHVPLINHSPTTVAIMTHDCVDVLFPFAAALSQLHQWVLQEIDREVAEKHLCYHNREHSLGVQRRASQIFQTVRPYFATPEATDRLEQLLELCALAHDMVQIFLPQPDEHAPRRRQAGVSETATIEQLFQLIGDLNSQSEPRGQFSAAELAVMQEAIAATICDYDPAEQAIFQPALYAQPSISPLARSLALADIGTLAMEGIAAYNAEGHLLFLEENPDVRSLVEQHQLEPATAQNPDLAENIRQRLLRRARFQVSFARSRLNRTPRELAGFPDAAVAALYQTVFLHLTPATIHTLEATTPTQDDTPLEVLLTFFQFRPLDL